MLAALFGGDDIAALIVVTGLLMLPGATIGLVIGLVLGARNKG